MANNQQSGNACANFERRGKSSKENRQAKSRKMSGPPSCWGINMVHRDDEKPEMNTSQPPQNRTTEEPAKLNHSAAAPVDPIQLISFRDFPPNVKILETEKKYIITQNKDNQISILKCLLDKKEKKLKHKNKQLEENQMMIVNMEGRNRFTHQSKNNEIFKLKNLLGSTKAQLLEKTQQLEEYKSKSQTNSRLQSYEEEVNTMKCLMTELKLNFQAEKNQLVAETDALRDDLHQLNNRFEDQNRSFGQQQAEAMKIIRDKDLDLKNKDLLMDERLRTFTKIGNALKKVEDLKIKTDQCTQLVKEKAEDLKVIKALEETHCHTKSEQLTLLQTALDEAEKKLKAQNLQMEQERCEHTNQCTRLVMEKTKAVKVVAELEEAACQKESQFQQQLTLLQTSQDRIVKELHAQNVQMAKEQSENAKTISTLMVALAQTKKALKDAQANAGQQEHSLLTSTHKSEDKEKKKEEASNLKARWKKFKRWLKNLRIPRTKTKQSNNFAT